MKNYSCALVLALAIFGYAAAGKINNTPVTKVVQLLGDVKSRIEADGKAEQSSYDKFACWTEETLARKAKDIDEAKTRIEELSNLILKLEGELGSHGAEIEQLKKDIAANQEAQKEATDVRNSEYKDFEGEKTESEQCIGALESAIKVLTGAGSGKNAGFLETMQEAQVMSAAAGVRQVLNQDAVTESVSDQDMEVVKHFVTRPQDFLQQNKRALSAVQTGQNPFGDYAPQSTQIQGILKGMYDAFTSDLEKDNAEEAEKEKAYRAFMETKKRELEALQATLQTQELAEAQKKKQLSDSNIERDDTTEQQAADEEFFDATKKGGSMKAQEWSERSRLRTAELQGIIKAVEILSGGSKTFTSAFTTLAQISVVTKFQSNSAGRTAAFTRLHNLALKYRSRGMAKLAAQVKTDGHFDKVMAMIDQMIDVLRKEEVDDIAHRDRCENAQNKNSNKMEDMSAGIDKADAELERMNNTQADTREEITTLEEAIANSKKDMAELLEMRNDEVKKFKTALKDDANAIDLISQAIVSLTKFYKDNDIPLELVQKQEPEYTIDPDQAPETVWENGAYGGRKDESGGIVAILSMLREDLEKEMKVAREEDAEAQSDFEKARGKLKDTLEAQSKSLVEAEKELAEIQGKMADTEEQKGQLATDKANEQDLQNTLEKDCSWVATHFESRRQNRKAEMEGLVDAKNFLAGATE